MKLYFTFFLFLSSIVQFGQPKKMLTSLGIKSGVNFAKISVTQSTGLVSIIESSNQVGFNGGLVFKHIGESNPPIGIQIELNFSQRGWHETSDSISDFYSRKQSYLELPILTNITFFKNQKLKGIVNIGLNLAYLISDKESTNSDAPVSRSYYNQDVNNKIDYGVALGGGFNYDFKASSLQLELRYYRALSDLFEPNDEFSTLQHQIIGLNLTYFFWVKRY